MKQKITSMKQKITSMKQKITLAIICTISIIYSSKAQWNFTISNSSNTAGTYTDLGTNGTAITTNFGGTAMTFDDDNSSVQNIGFNFSFNGTTFTQFVLNTNGFIILGSAAPSANNIFYSDFQSTTGGCINATDNNLIYAFNKDLQAGTSPEFRVFTTGSVGSRICTIQYKNMADKAPIATNAQYANINFQIKLNEGSNKIDFVYGTWTGNANASVYNTSAVGIKGTGVTNSMNATKASTGAWSTTTFLSGNYTGNTHNYGNGTRPAPDAGRTYSFLPTAANDLVVTKIETLGKIATVAAFPHSIKAIVTNNGSNAIPAGTNVTLSITGSNTVSNVQTTSALAPGASQTITFDPISSMNVGTNNITVSVPSDDNNANNSAIFTQTVLNTGFAYADASALFTNVGYNAGSGLLVNAHNLPKAITITAVRVYLTTTSNTVFGVVTDAAGTILGQSADYNVVPADSLNYKTFTLTTPVNIAANTTFFIGLGQRVGTYGYYPVGSQAENPARGNTFASMALAGGAPTYYTTLGRFMIEAVINQVVPVTLGEFKGIQTKDANILNWTTATETNNAGFNIERSTDGTNFSSIGNIASKASNGNSNTTINYEFADTKPFVGNNYYRLKQTDKDGKYTYSQIVLLKSIKAGISIVAVYPNPAKDKVNITLSTNNAEKATIVLYDISGKAVMQNLINLTVGETIYSQNISKLKTGSYLLKVIDEKGNTVDVKSIIKQ